MPDGISRRAMPRPRGPPTVRGHPRAGSSRRERPSIAKRPDRSPARRCRCGSAGPRSVGCRRPRRRGGGGPRRSASCATNAPPSSTSSHSTACGESSDAWKPAAWGRTVRQPRSGRNPGNARLGRSGPPDGSEGPPDGVDALVATLGRPGPDVGAVTVEAAAAARAAGVEEEASSRPGTADAGLDLEPDAQLVQAGAQARRPAGRRPGRRRPREPVHAAARRPGGPLALEDLDGARESSWSRSTRAPWPGSGTGRSSR